MVLYPHNAWQQKLHQGFFLLLFLLQISLKQINLFVCSFENFGNCFLLSLFDWKFYFNFFKILVFEVTSIIYQSLRKAIKQENDFRQFKQI